MTGSQLLAHIGPLATHDLWLIIPMAVLSAAVIVVMVRPRQAPPPPPSPPGDDQAGGSHPPPGGGAGRPGPGPDRGRYR